MKTYTYDDRTMKEKIRSAKAKVSIKVKDTLDWIKVNPKEAAAILGAGALVLKTVYKVGRDITDSIEEKEREKEVYCNDIQSTVKLKHKLSYYEARELRDRMNEGQSKFEALDSMGLLKK